MIPRSFLVEWRRGLITSIRADQELVRYLEEEPTAGPDAEWNRQLHAWLLARALADADMARAIEAALDIQPIGRTAAAH